MAQVIIQERCTRCGVCLPACPNDGIEVVEGAYVIRDGLCTECYGFHAAPKCAEVCPVEAVADDGTGPLSDEEAGLRAFWIHPERFAND